MPASERATVVVADAELVQPLDGLVAAGRLNAELVDDALLEELEPLVGRLLLGEPDALALDTIDANQRHVDVGVRAAQVSARREDAHEPLVVVVAAALGAGLGELVGEGRARLGRHLGVRVRIVVVLDADLEARVGRRRMLARRSSPLRRRRLARTSALVFFAIRNGTQNN